ncbi:MAG: hypothetical protein K6E20_06980, partial [Acholeplasmatales bacterium]|nr:hypothetical protein [Acholeplasmatales bacterium]
MRYKKIIIFFIVSFLLVAYFPECFETKAAMENEYLTYQEIIMSSGKLIKNFTNEEKANAISKINYTKPFEVAYYFDNQNVEASYISETTELIENNGTGVIERNVSVVVETNKKVTLNMSGSVASTTKSNLKSIKNEITSKAGVEYSTSTTKSVKEVNEFLVKVEPNS